MTKKKVIQTVARSGKTKNNQYHDMYIMACIFKSDAEALDNRRTSPQFFLYAHAIELFLKSRISNNLVTKNIGHDLGKLTSEARKIGLSCLSQNDEKLIIDLDKANKAAALRYRIDFELNFDIPDLHRITELLSDEVGQFLK